MRPRSAAVIACRVIALWLGIEAVTGAFSLIITLSETDTVTSSAGLWAYLIARGAIAAFLWLQAREIGDAIARDTVDEATTPSPRTANTHAVAFSVVGLILSVNGLTGLIGTAVSESEFGSFSGFTRGAFFGFGGGRASAVVIELVTLGIGLYLVLRSASLARYLSRSYPEHDPPASAQPPTA
jgi:hypothetical protein